MDGYRNPNLKWVSKIEIVVISTGEIITKKQFKNEDYEVVKKVIRNEYGTTENTRVVQWQVRYARQQKIEFK